MPAETIGKYEIVAEIGQGGFGRVFKAYDPQVARNVAIKLLSAGGDAEMLDRFRREVSTTGQLQHKNIVSVYGAGEHKGALYLVMELLEGRTLQQLIAEKASLSFLDKARILLQIGEALNYAHQHGIVHRDIKPGNVMVLPDGSVKLMDFGIARFADDTQAPRTEAGYIIGTIPYLSPEQFQGSDSDALTDIFAFGALAYELLAGTHPFAASGTGAVMSRILSDQPEPLTQVVPNCPPSLDLLVRKALAKDREIRYQSVNDLVLDLQPAVTDLAKQRAAELIDNAEFSLMVNEVNRALKEVTSALELDPGEIRGWQLRDRLQTEMRAAKSLEAAKSRKEEPAEPGEFTRLFQPGESKPAPSRDPDKKVSAPGEFTRMFDQPFPGPPRLPASPVPPQAPVQVGPGEFTRIFGAPSAPAPKAAIAIPAPSPAGGVSPWLRMAIPATGVAVLILVLRPDGLGAAVIAAVVFLTYGVVQYTTRTKQPVTLKHHFVDPPVSAATPRSPSVSTDTVIEPLPLVSKPGSRVGSAAADRTVMLRIQDLPGAAPGGAFLFVSRCADPSLMGRTEALTKFPFTIGRADADFSIANDLALSREHAAIDFKEGAFLIKDLGSANGIYLNGMRLKLGVAEPLPFTSEIRLSSGTTLVFNSRDVQRLPDLTGTLIANRYTLKREIHSSLKGAAYEAFDENISVPVMVKVFSPHLSSLPGYAEHFRNEALAASGLRHPNICPVRDFGETQLKITGASLARAFYLCTDYFQGGSLSGRLADNQPVPHQQAIAWLTQVGTALDKAHEQGLVHAGLKPDSVLLDDSGRAMLTDFASAIRPGTGKKWALMGSAAFIAPEQWEGEQPTPHCDQYSLGVLAYMLLTGARPFEGQEDPEVRRKNFLRGPWPAHQEAERNGREPLPAAVSIVLGRTLATKPGDRFGSNTEFVANLEMAFTKVSRRATGPPRVFISYQREPSGGWANLFADKLKEKHGIVSFLDTVGADSAEPFIARIEHEIENADAFVCFLAKGTLGSAWVRKEIQLAHEKRKPMIPIFQESYLKPEPAEELESHVLSLLEYEGVHLLDRKSIHVDHSVSDLARLVLSTVRPDR